MFIFFSLSYILYMKQIVFNRRNELLRVPLLRAMFYEAYGNYCYGVFPNKQKVMLPVGLAELEKRVSEDMEIAFSMYPTSIDELLAVADAGLLMPPKSTWFEPKLRSGIFIHRLS